MWERVRGEATLRVLAGLTDAPLHLVGGAVRDLLRGAGTVHDWDVLVPEGALVLARRLADATGGACVILHAVQPTARVVRAGVTYDLIAYRAGDLASDLRARDLTINAIALDLRVALAGGDAAILDPCGGVADLATRRLRPCAAGAFRADPLRALRLYRFAATLGYLPTPAAERQARDAAPLLATVAPERVADELGRLFAGADAARAIRGFVRSGIWEAIAPEATAGRGMSQSANHHLDVFDHDTAAAVAVARALRRLDAWGRDEAAAFRVWLDAPVAGGRARRWLVPFAALMHDMAKPMVRVTKPDGTNGFPRHEQAGAALARTVAQRLKLSRHEADLLGAFVRQHARPADLRQHGPDHPLRVLAVLRDAAPGAIVVALGDRATARGPARPPSVVRRDVRFLRGLLRNYFATYAPLLATPSLVRGDDLIAALGLPPGRHIGYLLLLLRRRQLAGLLRTRAAALATARTLLAQSGSRIDARGAKTQSRTMGRERHGSTQAG